MNRWLRRLLFLLIAASLALSGFLWTSARFSFSRGVTNRGAARARHDMDLEPAALATASKIQPVDDALPDEDSDDSGDTGSHVEGTANSSEAGGDSSGTASHESGSFAGEAPLIGDASRCAASRGCTMCNDFLLDNSDVHVPPSVQQYLSQHVLFGVITGSFEHFFRVDVGYCTWMAHLPISNVFIFTDRANTSGNRPGTWLDPQLPAKVRFSPAQLRAKGYTIHWIRAQYRFIQAMQMLGSMARKGEPVRHAHWVVVVDDDTFVDVRALARLLHNYDMRNLRNAIAKNVSFAFEDSSSLKSGPATIAARRPDEGDEEQLALISAARDAIGMTYLGDKGWGGAGHFLNYGAATYFAERSDECVDQFMVRRFLASDETLKRCLPRLGGIQVVNERLLSHCQAHFLKKRLLRGDHATSHAKRDFVLPRKLAIWRLRLYYQVVYHRNLTAYRLLQKVGACAFGYSCKIKSCDAQHDSDALQLYLNLSGNDSFVPLI
jgi:hypothetical protein